MRVDLSAVLPCKLEDAVSQVMTTRLLQYVAHPLVSFSPLRGGELPQTWSAGTHWVRLKLFGFLPFGRQAIEISMPNVANAFAIRDAGYSALIPVWDHLITIESSPGGVRYRDQVEVRARILTPVEATCRSDGCITYDAAEDPFDPGLIRFSELWPGHESLAKHLEAPHIEPWRAAARRCGLLERKFTAYDITGSRAV